MATLTTTAEHHFNPNHSKLLPTIGFGRAQIGYFMIPRSLSCYQTTEGISNVERVPGSARGFVLGAGLMPDAALADLSEGWMRPV